MATQAPRFTQLDQWLSWMETLHPREIELGLSRVQRVAERLQINRPRKKVITVAGTNGKGSCVASLEKLLCDAGNCVGAYTSPHLLAYNERIRIDGVNASDVLITEAFTKIDAARGDISLTYFEFATLAALLIFSRQSLDFWLLEVGLGGRLDAVNIISPDIAVISSIDLDHQAWLGDTRDEIAVEKLGVLRPKIPCVCAEINLTESMERTFVQLETDTYLRDKDFGFSSTHAEDVTFSLTTTERNISELRLPRPNIPLPSLAAALQVLALCHELPAHAQIATSIASLELRGRFQVIEFEHAQCVLDVAHNPAACRLLAQKLSAHTDQKVIAVVGMMKDKHISDCLAPLLPYVDRWLVTELAECERSAKREDITAYLSGLNVNDDCVRAFADVDSTMRVLEKDVLRTDTSQYSTVLVFGSFLTVAGVLSYFDRHETLSSM